MPSSSLATLGMGLLLPIALAGCASSSGGEAARTIALADFSRPAPEGMILGHSPLASMRPAESDAPGEADFAGDDPVEDAAPQTTSSTGGAPAGGAATGGTRAAAAPEPPRDVTVDPEGNERWIVDALVGQINGRPVFADEFLEPIAARLQELARAPDRALARRQMVSLVHERFDDWVNSELVISEAESSLTPEQQQGFFGWLKTMQEGTIAEYAGSREEAREAMRDDLGMDIDEFMQQRRDAALAQFLLDRKVKPRTIVAWRDVEREYGRRQEEFNPPAKVSIGRIALDTGRDAEKVAQVKQWLAEGKAFGEIADSLGLEKRGVVVQVPMAAGASVDDAVQASEDIAPAVKERLKGVAAGAAGAPIERGTAITWLGIVEVTQAQGRTLFDPEVQIQLKRELDGVRSTVERSRYIARLRSRWVSDDINRIEERLLLIAFERYFR